MALKVLIVDDYLPAANMVESAFESLGCETRIATTGMQALQFNDSFEPDLIFLDIGLPGGMSGHEVCGHIRKTARGKTIRIIAQTGWDDEEHRKHAKRMGFDDYIVKPISYETIEKLTAGISAGTKEFLTV